MSLASLSIAAWKAEVSKPMNRMPMTLPPASLIGS
jgi:hypothetical protein